MSSWALRRQVLIISFIIAVTIGFFYFIYANFFYTGPTCSDGIQNGREEGIDCGGGCVQICPFSATETNVLWSRSFQVVDGVYNIAALVSNPNFDLRVSQGYRFQMYNRENVLVEEVTGLINLAPAEVRPIFIPTVNVGEREISSTFFSFTGEPVLERGEELDRNIIVRSRRLVDTDTEPELYVTLYNQSIRPQQNLEVVAVLYDRNDNVYQASKTFVDSINRDSEAEIFFTWPQPFDQEIAKTDIFVITQQ